MVDKASAGDDMVNQASKNCIVFMILLRTSEKFREIKTKTAIYYLFWVKTPLFILNNGAKLPYTMLKWYSYSWLLLILDTAFSDVHSYLF
ncbi:hypothetical protein HCUR_01446 [Holospora curviuscula]|uniref:Uncharacterized protein n=1 Tax=Holospora curviuscula TaxID=1082868 RepID=A0A2S5R756_9PROT|nr:hypothetical protein HCUR_01446 [Holospora curviuscula]